MVEYRVLSTFVSRRLNTDLKDFTFDLWKKRGTMKTVKIYALVIGFPEGGDPGLMWGNTGTLWGLCNKFLPLWWGKCGDLDF